MSRRRDTPATAHEHTTNDYSVKEYIEAIREDDRGLFAACAFYSAMTATSIADHAIGFGGGHWSVWRDAILRSTGFPADGLALLSEQECARVADSHMAGQVERRDFDEAFAEAAARNSLKIHSIACDPMLRSAITWQSLSALISVDKVREAGPEPRRTARHRSRERMVVRYWQRYCGKAETIGFFGPVCWARIDLTEPAIAAHPGSGLIRDRFVYFDYWALAALADQLASEPSVRPWLAPTLCPQLTLRERDVIDPVRSPTRLTVAQAAVVSRCDGRRRGWQVAAEAVSDSASGLRNTADAYLVLDRLVQREILRWDFDLPVSFDAEPVLRERIGLIADDGVRAAAEVKLRALGACRDSVAAATKDPDALAQAMLRLEDVFTELSGSPARRAPGRMYAARTLCVEEATRDLDITFGRAVLAAIAPPLAVPLAVADWICCALAEAYLAELERLHADLGPGDVPLGQLWFLAQDLFYGTARRPADQVAAELRQRWASLFGLDSVRPADARLDFSSHDLAARVAALFPSGPITWSTARIHSPDLQFGARSVESFARGDFSVVLGEMHAAWPAAGIGVFVCGHPEPRRLRDALRRDLAGQSIYPLLPLDWPRHTPRLAFALEHPKDAQLGFKSAPGADSQRLVPVSSVLVRRSQDELTAVADDGRSWPLLETFGRLLSETAVEVFKFTAAEPHTPRITVDRLVVSRESWRMTLGDCPVTTASGEREEYLGARRWKAAYGLPDYIFVKLATETKPIFVDVTSPAYASMLAAALRAARREQGDLGSLQVTEMLPTPDEAWIPDADGRCYVGELRLHVRNDRLIHTEDEGGS